MFLCAFIRYGLAFSLGISFISIGVSVFFLSKLRFETGKSLGSRDNDDVDDDIDVEQVEIPFQRVNLTFQDVHYTVKSSISDEHIELLKGIDGFVQAGKMTALMGSSGAGVS
jgi:ABC-type transport system involved in Fe-S cluster assembly fused permease/ATPase subunit